MTYRGVLLTWHSFSPALPLSTPDIPKPIQAALLRRGINPNQFPQYFKPRLTEVPSPFLLPQIEEGLELLQEALTQKRTIFVVSDYDVDGITSSTLWHLFLKRHHHPNFHIHIPDRHTEGYGISTLAVQKAIEYKTGLFIAVDCGTKDIHALNQLHMAGIPTLVIDHHTVEPDAYPPASAFINPKRPDSQYPNPHLSAGALTYKFLRAYEERYGGEPAQIDEMLDLVAISLLADIMPLSGENRILAWTGMQLLQEKPRPGLAALFEVAKISPQDLYRSSTLLYQLIPRLNAAGRIAQPQYAFDLLRADHRSEETRQLASELNRLNKERQKLQDTALGEALKQIQPQAPGIVAYNPHWHKGVIGLVASKIVEKYHRPAVILTQDSMSGLIVGSARSPESVPLYDLLDTYCRSYLVKFGGHEKAAGMSLRPEQLEDFTKAFLQGCAASGIPSPIGWIDAELSHQDILADRIAEWVEKFEPFGPANRSPRFLVRGLRLQIDSDRILLCYGATMFEANITDPRKEELKARLGQYHRQPVSVVVTPRLDGKRTKLQLRDIIVE